MKNFQNAGRDYVESDESSDASAPADGPQRVGGTEEGGVGGPHWIRSWVVDSAWFGLACLGLGSLGGYIFLSFFYVLVARPPLVILVFVDASLASWLSAQHQKRFAVCLWDL